MNLTEAVALANTWTENRPRPYRGPFGSIYDDLTPQLWATGLNRFATSLSPIVPVTLVVIADSAPVSAANIDEETGEFDLDPLPTASLMARYHYRRFTDAMVTDFLTLGVRWLRYYADISDVPDGLHPAVMHQVRGEGFTILATRYSEQVNVSVGPRSEARGSIAQEYRAKADAEFALAEKLKDEFYQRSGRQYEPGVARYTYSATPYTPRR